MEKLKPHFLSWDCTLSGNSHASKFRRACGGAFLPPRFSSVPVTPHPVFWHLTFSFFLSSAYIAQAGPKLALYLRTNLDFWSSERESMWQSSPGEEGLERSAANSSDELWSCKGAPCVCSHLVLQRAVTEHEGPSWTQGWETLKGAGSAHHLQAWANPSFSLWSPVSCSAQWFPHSREGFGTVEARSQQPWQETPCLLGGVHAPCKFTLPTGLSIPWPQSQVSLQTPWLDCKTHTRAVFPLGSWGWRGVGRWFCEKDEGLFNKKNTNDWRCSPQHCVKKPKVWLTVQEDTIT